MPKKKRSTVKEYLYWSYANLAMAHTAVGRKQKEYDSFNYKIRARLFKGLIDGSMDIKTIFDDEKIKLASGQQCSYCGSENSLSLDHLFPKKLGGKDSGDNLIYACKSCNSSKGKKDLMEWMNFNDTFPPLLILRRYLKLVIMYCIKENLMEKSVEELEELQLSFDIKSIPLKYPKPDKLKLIVVK